MTMQFREYQNEAIHECRHLFSRGKRRIILQAPTGSGKTVIAAQIVEGALKKQRRVLFLAHRRELVQQCADKLRRFGVDYGIIMAGEDLTLEYEVQVASIDTLRSRCLRAKKVPMPKADVIVIDECHRSLAPTYLKIIEHYSADDSVVILGLSATPIRSDGRGLGHIYDGMVCCPSVRELTDMGYLVPAEYFAPTIPDLTGIKIVRGDYDEKELQKAMDQRKAVGDVVENWGRIGRDRPTIVFASGVRHSMSLRDEFVKAGVRAVHVDGDSSLYDRSDALEGLHSGKYQVITNCMVLTEGFDEPKLSCCVLVRPTKNVGLYLQMAGRTLRPADGKRDCRIIDHSGNVYEHGFVADERDWSLEVGKPLGGSEADKRKKKDRLPICCIKCARVYDGQLRCPHCGHLPEKRGKFVETRHADLSKVDEEQRRSAKKQVYTHDDKQRWYSMLLHYACQRRRTIGWVAHTYRDKFGVWPKNMMEAPITPEPDVLGFIRYKNIQYAKRQEKIREHEAANKGSGEGKVGWDPARPAGT